MSNVTASARHAGKGRDVPVLDALVIGAGFAGLYMLHRLRETGRTALVLERGAGVGGTWYWNRYPGARVDVQGVEYSYSFSPEIEQEWDWSELMPAQDELERYLNFVTDRLDLRRDIRFDTTVVAAHFDDAHGRWTVHTDDGSVYVARVVVAATGCLSEPLEPAIEGRDDFTGVSLYTSRFPRDGFDFTGKKVGVIGTGSSGVQAIPVIAETAGHLHVFQRSAAFTRPANNRPITAEEMAAIKADYPAIRRQQLESYSGTLHFAAVALPATPPADRILDTPAEERLAKVDRLGWGAAWDWADIAVDPDANRAGVELFAEMLRRTVDDPDVAEALVPHYPLACKRLIIDTDYVATFNRPNVTLVDLRQGGIERITATGIQTAQGHVDLDVIVFATGFDAMTGALNRIDIRGRDGQRLRDVWADGPRALLGLQVAGFPNLFTITGPGSPSVHSNMVVAIEQHVDWIIDCLDHVRAIDATVVEATEGAQDEWVRHVAELASGSVRSWDSCNSWYTGANVPGKPRVYLAYLGGQPAYTRHCDEVAACGYPGFVFG
jgi:cation diffusion facilitator CzcD-associated flavoprotein CzcO